MADSELRSVLKLRIRRLIASLFIVTVLVGLAGAWPTWRLAGREGLWAAAAAGLIVLVVMIGVAVIASRLAGRGVAVLAGAFVYAGLGRAIVALAAAVAAYKLMGLKLLPLLVWIAFFYVSLLVVESIWLQRELKAALKK